MKRGRNDGIRIGKVAGAETFLVRKVEFSLHLYSRINNKAKMIKKRRKRIMKDEKRSNYLFVVESRFLLSHLEVNGLTGLHANHKLVCLGLLKEELVND